jgi:hypothetical protein
MAELVAAMSLSLEDCTFIILLDSIQKLFHEANGGTKEKFQQLMTNIKNNAPLFLKKRYILLFAVLFIYDKFICITQLMCESQAYIVVACSATFHNAVEKFVACMSSSYCCSLLKNFCSIKASM